MKRLYFVESTKNGNLMWLRAFEKKEDAETVLHCQEYEFRDREIISKTEAVKRWGKRIVDEIVSEGDFNLNYYPWYPYGI